MGEAIITRRGGGASVNTVQRGTASMGGILTTDITIAEIDSGSSIIRIINPYSHSATVARLMFAGQIINDTTIRISRESSEATNQNIEWEVTEYKNVKSKQTGITTGNATITSVDPSKSIILSSATSSLLSNTIVDLAFTYKINSATLVTNTGISKTHYWQVIEFK